MNEIKAGDMLADIRRSGNLYVPFGTEEIRLVEDIHTGDWQYIRTDGTVVLALLDSPGRIQSELTGWATEKGNSKCKGCQFFKGYAYCALAGTEYCEKTTPHNH